jgi:hypothetical protein
MNRLFLWLWSLAKQDGSKSYPKRRYGPCRRVSCRIPLDIRIGGYGQRLLLNRVSGTFLIGVSCRIEQYS